MRWHAPPAHGAVGGLGLCLPHRTSHDGVVAGRALAPRYLVVVEQACHAGGVARRVVDGGRLWSSHAQLLLGASAATLPHMWKERGQPARFLLSSGADRGS